MKCQSVAVAISLAVLLGCQDPPDITPVGPPGVEARRMPIIPENEAAQAIGEQPLAGSAEQAAQSKTAPPRPPVSTAISPPTKVGETVTTASGLKYSTLKEGTGEEAKPGQTVSIHYTGTFTNGEKFDSSRDRDQPLFFHLGMGQMIKGMDEGVAGMRLGEQRRLQIPAKLAYGSRGQDKIPPNSALIFDVELMSVK
jgi:FKBP-type peptidyl-prolyl cis-trans isomerase FkpA